MELEGANLEVDLGEIRLLDEVKEGVDLLGGETVLVSADTLLLGLDLLLLLDCSRGTGAGAGGGFKGEPWEGGSQGGVGIRGSGG